MTLKNSNFRGTGDLIRLIFRRDRFIIPLLLIFLILLFVAIAASFVNLYDDATLREALVLQVASNPAIVAFLGSIQDSSIGGLVAWRSAVFGPILVAVVNIFLMIRHTRSEERKGRLELLNSTAVGRYALLASALLTTCGFNLFLGVVIVLSFIGLGLPWEGSLIFALIITLFGCLFAAISGVAVQLTENSADARYISVAILIAFFLLRIIGWDDGNVTGLSWVSPLGWVHYINAFGTNEWWILGLFLLFIVGLTLLAYYLSSIRDLGAGILPQRTGPAQASYVLVNTLGLTWRLHRGMLIFWIIGFAIMGILLGLMAQTVTDIFADNPQFMIILAQLGKNVQPLDSYLTLMLVLFGQVFAIYGIITALKLRSQEVKGYSEFIITNAVSKTKWMMSNLLYAFFGPVVILTIFILCYSLSYGLVSGNMGQDLFQYLTAAWAYLPAIWVMVGITVALFGLIPRFSALSWAIFGLFLIINFLADFLDIKQWILDISPFNHIPNLLVGDTVSSSFYLLLVGVAILTLLGIWGYRRRDITG